MNNENSSYKNNPERNKLMEIMETRIKEYESLYGEGSWERDHNFSEVPPEVYERMCEYPNDFAKIIDSKKRPNIPTSLLYELIV